MSRKDSVTIAIPAFNEDQYLGEAISSALMQGSSVLVCDNASTDCTEEVCQRFLSTNRNLYYIKQPSNLGALANFKYGLDWAQTPYFMWLGAHDVLPPDYVSLLCRALDENPSAVMTFGSVRCIDQLGHETHSYEYEFARALASHDAYTRLLAIAKNLYDCTLVHGLFRRENLLNAWLDESSLGVDHALLARAALGGALVHVPGVFYIRRVVGKESSDSEAERLSRINPAARMASDMNRYDTMISQEMSLFDLVQGSNWVSRKFFRIIARYHYLRRFGSWGRRGTPERFFNDTAWQAIRILARTKRIIRKIFLVER